LEEEVVARKFRTTTQHGAIKGKTHTRDVLFYNLDVIISVGYRVKSKQGTQFRIWATQRLKKYIKTQKLIEKENSLKEIEQDIRKLSKKIRKGENE